MAPVVDLDQLRLQQTVAPVQATIEDAVLTGHDVIEKKKSWPSNSIW
jgi:hypothetical protein